MALTSQFAFNRRPKELGDRVAVKVGQEFGTVTPQQVKEVPAIKPMIAVIFVVLHAARPVYASDDGQVALPPLVPSRVYSHARGPIRLRYSEYGGQARAEGGEIEITAPRSDTLAAVLSGSVAANAYLGCPGSAAERFELVQEFEIACSDKNVKTAKLTLGSVLAGFVRSKHRAGAGMRLASARVCPLGSTEPVVIITHPPLGVAGSDVIIVTSTCRSSRKTRARSAVILSTPS